MPRSTGTRQLLFQVDAVFFERYCHVILTYLGRGDNPPLPVEHCTWNEFAVW